MEDEEVTPEVSWASNKGRLRPKARAGIPYTQAEPIQAILSEKVQVEGAPPQRLGDIGHRWGRAVCRERIPRLHPAVTRLTKRSCSRDRGDIVDPPRDIR